jgi:hypothetical protein
MSTGAPSAGAAAPPAFRHHLRPMRIVAAFALLGVAAVVAHNQGITMWALVPGLIGPDLSFLSAVGAPHPADGTLPRRAVRAYNALHHLAGPIALTAGGLALGIPLAVTIGLAWLAHLLLDRGLGYHVRNLDGTIRRR